MSSRSVSVVLTAQVQNYLSNMRSAEQHTRDVERAARSATEQFRIHNEALTKVGIGMTAVGAAAALGLGVAIKASTEYGAKLAQLQSLSHASAGEMQRLSDAAMKQGQAFGYSATQVADAEIELTKAGRSTAQMLGGDLKGALALAAAGQMDVAEATSIGVTAITQFASSGATIPHVADLLAAGADKALGSVQDLGMALKQGGLVAAQMGLSVDDTVGTLSAFAQAGLIGSDAGTSLKTMLLSLQSPSTQAQQALDRYNITAYDSKGAFVGITNLAGQLHDKLHDVSQAQRDAALSTIFGSDAIRSANVLYKEGAGGIAGWIDKVGEAGFASAQAAGKLNSLQGDLQKLSAAFETDMIKGGQSADGFLRGRVQSITAFVTALGDVPAPAQAALVAAGAVVAGVALVGGAALVAVPKINAARVAMGELGLTSRQVGGLIGKGSGVLLGIMALTSGLAGLAEHGTAGEDAIKKTGDAMKKGWAGLDASFGKAGTSVFSGSGLKASLQELSPDSGMADTAKFFDGITGGIAHLSDVYKGNEATFDAMGQQLAGLAQQDYSRAASSFSTLVDKYHLGAAEQAQLLDEMPAYRDQLAHMATQAGVSTDKQSLLNYAQLKGADAMKILGVSAENAAAGGEAQAGALKVLAGTADIATTSVKDLSDAIDGLDHGELSARSAARAYEKALDDATAAIKKNGQTAIKHGTELDISTEKGRANADALDGIAAAAKTSASAYLKAGGNAAGAQKIIDDGRKAYENAAHAMGLSRDAAHRLAQALLGIPGTVNPYVTLTGAETAAQQLKGLQDYITWLKKHGDFNVSGHVFLDESVNKRLGRAAGGAVDGSGPTGVDSVPAMLAPGEHVLTSSDVARMGGQSGVYSFRASLAAGNVDGYAKGGAVKRRRGSDVHLALRAPKPKPRKAPGFGGIVDQTKIAAHAATVQAEQQKRLDAARKRLAGQEKAAKAAETRAQKARDAAAKIYGKGSGPAKHAATMRARAASAAAKRATDAAKATQKTIDAATKARDAAKQDHADALAAAATLRQGSEDFVSAERRNPDRVSTDPLQYVDQLRQMSRDPNFSATRRKAMDAAANQYEADLVRLGKSSTEAAKKLDDLKQSSTQLHDSVKSAVSGGYTLGGAAQSQTASGWVVRDGIRYQTTSSGPTAGSISAYFHQGHGTADAFAAALQQLAGRGLDVTLLAQLAGMGTEQGMPIAQALLSASPSELGSINSDVAGIASAAERAGSTVADATYAEQIAAADRNAAEITAQIAADGAALRKLLARAFGLSGYAVGTDSATPGLHLVGEQGPELIGFRGGEKVLRAPDTARWIRGASTGGGAGGGVVRLQVEIPTSLDLVDAGGGLITTMHAVARDVAVQEITADALHDAVLLAGGAA